MVQVCMMECRREPVCVAEVKSSLPTYISTIRLVQFTLAIVRQRLSVSQVPPDDAVVWPPSKNWPQFYARHAELKAKRVSVVGRGVKTRVDRHAAHTPLCPRAIPL